MARHYVFEAGQPLVELRGPETRGFREVIWRGVWAWVHEHVHEPDMGPDCEGYVCRSTGLRTPGGFMMYAGSEPYKDDLPADFDHTTALEIADVPVPNFRALLDAQQKLPLEGAPFAFLGEFVRMPVPGGLMPMATLVALARESHVLTDPTRCDLYHRARESSPARQNKTQEFSDLVTLPARTMGYRRDWAYRESGVPEVEDQWSMPLHSPFPIGQTLGDCEDKAALTLAVAFHTDLAHFGLAGYEPCLAVVVLEGQPRGLHALAVLCDQAWLNAHWNNPDCRDPARLPMVPLEAVGEEDPKTGRTLPCDPCDPRVADAYPFVVTLLRSTGARHLGDSEHPGVPWGATEVRFVRYEHSDALFEASRPLRAFLPAMRAITDWDRELYVPPMQAGTESGGGRGRKQKGKRGRGGGRAKTPARGSGTAPAAAAGGKGENLAEALAAAEEKEDEAELAAMKAEVDALAGAGAASATAEPSVADPEPEPVPDPKREEERQLAAATAEAGVRATEAERAAAALEQQVRAHDGVRTAWGGAWLPSERATDWRVDKEHWDTQYKIDQTLIKMPQTVEQRKDLFTTALPLWDDAAETAYDEQQMERVRRDAARLVDAGLATVDKMPEGQQKEIAKATIRPKLEQFKVDVDVLDRNKQPIAFLRDIELENKLLLTRVQQAEEDARAQAATPLVSNLSPAPDAPGTPRAGTPVAMPARPSLSAAAMQQAKDEEAARLAAEDQKRAAEEVAKRWDKARQRMESQQRRSDGVDADYARHAGVRVQWDRAWSESDLSQQWRREKVVWDRRFNADKALLAAAQPSTDPDQLFVTLIPQWNEAHETAHDTQSGTSVRQRAARLVFDDLQALKALPEAEQKKTSTNLLFQQLYQHQVELTELERGGKPVHSLSDIERLSTDVRARVKEATEAAQVAQKLAEEEAKRREAEAAARTLAEEEAKRRDVEAAAAARQKKDEEEKERLEELARKPSTDAFLEFDKQAAAIETSIVEREAFRAAHPTVFAVERRTLLEDRYADLKHDYKQLVEKRQQVGAKSPRGIEFLKYLRQLEPDQLLADLAIADELAVNPAAGIPAAPAAAVPAPVAAPAPADAKGDAAAPAVVVFPVPDTEEEEEEEIAAAPLSVEASDTEVEDDGEGDGDSEPEEAPKAAVKKAVPIWNPSTAEIAAQRHAVALLSLKDPDAAARLYANVTWIAQALRK